MSDDCAVLAIAVACLLCGIGLGAGLFAVLAGDAVGVMFLPLCAALMVAAVGFNGLRKGGRDDD